MHVARIQVTNLRALASFDLDLRSPELGGSPRRRQVLIGPNGVGKTTLLDALAHLFQPMTEASGAARLGRDDVRSGESEGRVDLTLHLDDTECRASRAPREDVVLHWRSQESLAALTGLGTGWVSVRTGHLIGAGSTTNPPISAGIEGLTSSSSSPTDLARAALEPNRPPAILLPADRGTLQWYPDLSVERLQLRPRLDALSRNPRRWAPLAARLALMWLRSKTDPEAVPFHRTWAGLQRHFPSMPVPVRAEGLRLWLRVPSGGVVPIERLSDGQRALLLVLAELASRDPKSGVVLFDEPEQHMHPAWTAPLFSILEGLYPGVQFLYTTHAPLFAHVAGEHARLGSDEAMNHDA